MWNATIPPFSYCKRETIESNPVESMAIFRYLASLRNSKFKPQHIDLDDNYLSSLGPDMDQQLVKCKLLI